MSMNIYLPEYKCEIHGNIRQLTICFDYPEFEISTDSYCMVCIVQFIKNNFKPVKRIEK